MINSNWLPVKNVCVCCRVRYGFSCDAMRPVCMWLSHASLLMRLSQKEYPPAPTSSPPSWCCPCCCSSSHCWPGTSSGKNPSLLADWLWARLGAELRATLPLLVSEVEPSQEVLLVDSLSCLVRREQAVTVDVGKQERRAGFQTRFGLRCRRHQLMRKNNFSSFRW